MTREEEIENTVKNLAKLRTIVDIDLYFDLIGKIDHQTPLWQRQGKEFDILLKCVKEL